MPLTKSQTFTINPNGILTEYLGKHPNIGKDNKAPFQVNLTAPGKAGNKNAQITWEEIKKHNHKNDCWIVIENNVYDITGYLRLHPGGDIILDAAGKDGTSLHHHYHPWVNVHRLIEKHQVGVLKRG
jgi:cytochrome b involved in lipid metabolism